MTIQDLSLFALLEERLGDRIQPIQATKAVLVDVSHTLEDMLLREGLPGLIFTGFQESSHWKKETERYRTLAGIAHQICIFAGGSLPREHDQAHIHVTLSGSNPLRQEWFLIVMSPRFAALLCGRDRLAPTINESERTFATYWSFEPEVIRDTLALLRDVVARERPDRLADLDDALARFPPVETDSHTMTALTTRMIDSMVREHQVRVQLERSMAYETRLRALGQVLSGVAHELNNPLQSVLGFTGMLIDDPSLSEPAREDLQHVLDAATRARTIVQSLLSLARANRESYQQVNIAELVRQTLIFVRGDAEAGQVAITTNVQSTPPPVFADPFRLQQLLINLLTNAIQALAGQSLPRRVVVTIGGTSERALLSIADNGPGIPPALHQRIFEPFFSTKSPGEGTGLGLSIVEAIVKEHHGSIALTSLPGEGTIFTIELPAERGAPAERGTGAPVDKRARLLVIDDDPQGRAVIQRMLERKGYYAVAFGSAAEALAALPNQPCDAIICDLRMPDMDGIQFHALLAAANPALARRIVFVTGDATRADVQRFLLETAAAYVLKPFTVAELQASLQKVLAEPGA